MAEPAVTVRLARLDEVGRLARLRRVWTEEDSGPVGDPGFEARYAAWHAREANRRLIWLAELAGEAIGMLNISVFERMPRPGRPDRRWGYVGNVFVLAAHRDRGVGAALVSAAVEHARHAGFVRLVLSPSERSVPLYLRAGFRPADSLMLLALDG
jgi:GNAT superfamily N-acetyltransferase